MAMWRSPMLEFGLLVGIVSFLAGFFVGGETCYQLMRSKGYELARRI